MRNVIKLENKKFKFGNHPLVESLEGVVLLSRVYLEEIKKYISDNNEIVIDEFNEINIEDLEVIRYEHEDNKPRLYTKRVVGNGKDNAVQPYLVIVPSISNDLKYSLIAVRPTEEELKRRKEVNKLKFTKASFVKWLKDNRDNLLVKNEYTYTDDYRYDYAYDFGKNEKFEEVDDRRFKLIVSDIESGSYSIDGNKESKVMKISSSWQYYQLTLKENN